MSLVLYLAIIGLLAIANFGTALSRKRDAVLAWAIVLVIWITFAGNDVNPDYAAYLSRWELVKAGRSYVGVSEFEPGFHLLMVISVQLGMTYQMFVALVASIGLALIHRTVLRFPGAANYVYPLYIVYPFIYDVIQLRNSLALAFLVYGIGVLVTGQRWRRIAFAACLAVSVSFHFTAIVYGIILLIPRIQDRRVGAWPILIGITGSFITLLNPSVAETIKGALELIVGDDSYQSYLETRAEREYVIPFVFQLWGLGLLIFARKALRIGRSDGGTTGPAYSSRWVTLALNLCILSFMILPLYAYGSNFWRIPRNVQIVYYVAFFLGQRALVGVPLQRLAFNVGVVFYSLGLLLIYSNTALVMVIAQNNAILAPLLGLPSQ